MFYVKLDIYKLRQCYIFYANFLMQYLYSFLTYLCYIK